MKKVFQYVFFLTLLIFCVFFDCVILKGVRLTLAFLIAFSFYFKKSVTVYIFSFAGLLCDFVSKTLPCFSFLYLYISLGCVWCERFFLNIGKKSFFLISIFLNLAFYFSLQIINMFIFYDISIGFVLFLKALVYSLINSAISLIIYCILRSFRFEN